MKEKIGFYGLMGCFAIGLILKYFIESDWIDTIYAVGFIFAVLYCWDEFRAYTRKKKIVLGIEFVILIATVPFILLEGGRQMDMMPIFQGWLSFARLVYLLIILGIVGMIVTKVNKKLLLGDDVSKT
ncbi:YoqO family protein [Bacillus pseudomycoides]|uniref:YoqO family protein n=1 Tax=Bacillus pseudomycoides TaxID=64104 RepID=UPI000BF1CF71|nr:YoqO family protein [Bacillus pseudomycoides]PEJ29750.1 hypothetical protein CN677_22960 [Bacillus pseudomycoides]PGE99662.1 hypothetical protein COM62_01415 [Bacillus pseudomycoides]PHA93023.1 hypothetical protein COE78_14740 [Bacillus pseudomycoides]PHB29484.1 hypothetical protein COE80_11500 [Bacillus pseudomycoides]PHC73521.1 hypothetical protein COF38_18370 [Bacillus pseudomycoides]